MILFVASNPSSLNTNPEIAMIGSKSERTFTRWVEYLIPDGVYRVINVSNEVTDDNKPLKRSQYNISHLIHYAKDLSITKVVALGNVAADALDQIEVQYFKLPHPSPLNRFLNNKEQVDAVLEECKKWLQ